MSFLTVSAITAPRYPSGLSFPHRRITRSLVLDLGIKFSPK
jgi:hypothetical protein